MTVILSLGNAEQIIQVSDRRLISDGFLTEDESNKAGVFISANARLVFGYTGLAKHGSFRTLFWLLESLVKLGPPDFQAGSILNRLKDKATKDFKDLESLTNIRAEYRRLSIIFSGYLYNYSPPRAGYAVMTNFQDLIKGQDAKKARDSFENIVFNEKIPRIENPVFIRPIGAWSAMKESDMSSLRDLLINRKPAKAIVNKAVEVIRNIADRPQTLGTVGKQLSSIILPRDLNHSAIAEYHTMTPKTIMYFPAVATSVPGKQIAIADPEYEISDKTGSLPIAFPKVGRNEPCPCGSGKKYKKCHGSSTNSHLDFLS